MYITIENFQQYSNVYSDNEELQQSYINSAENIIENYLGYRLKKQEYTITINGNGTNELQLRAKPITKISNVSINNKEIDIDEFYTENEFLYFKNRVFPIGNRNITIIYTAGYYVSNSEEDIMPEDNNCTCDNSSGSGITGDISYIDGGNANSISEITPTSEVVTVEEVIEDDTTIEILDEIPESILNDNETKIITNIPKIILMTILRLAAILQMESDGNIAITSKSFGEGGSRSFLNTTDYFKYLLPIAKYKLLRI